jgi:hypothetical protein
VLLVLGRHVSECQLKFVFPPLDDEMDDFAGRENS